MDLESSHGESVQPLQGESSTADSLPWNGTSSSSPPPPPSTKMSSLDYPQYFSLVYKIIGCSFVSVIFCVGFLGNLMVVYVVWRSRSMRTTTNCYLVSLAVADVLLLVSAPLPTLVEYFLIIDQSLSGAGGCSVMVFCQYLGVNLSSLSITAFTVERYIAICHPMRAQTLCTISRARRIISCLWVFGLVYCAPWLGLTTVRERTFADGTTIEQCDFRLERRHYLTYYVADLVIFYVIPLMLTCILYGLIARILYRSSSLGTAGNASSVAAASTVGGGGINHEDVTSNKSYSRAPPSCVNKQNAGVSSRIQVSES